MSTQSQGTSAPAVFTFESHPVRSLLIDDQPWFVCADVARALNYRDAEVASRHLDDDEKMVHQIGVPPSKGVHNLDTPGGIQRVTIINESGLYALVLRSRKPEARKFAKWVTSEVLPAIRQTGSYGNQLQKTQATAEGRWLLTVRDGKPCLSPLLADELVINPEELPALLRAGTSLPFDYFEIIEACNAHLKYVLQRIVAAVEARKA